MQERVEKIIGAYVYGYDGDTLPEVLGKELLAGKQTIAFAESCTGGLASSLMTDVPGSSEYVKGSVISYTNEVKNLVINVSKTTLSKKGAVSEEAALEMAAGVRNVIGSDMAVSISVNRRLNSFILSEPITLAALGLALDRLKEYPARNDLEETTDDHDADR